MCAVLRGIDERDYRNLTGIGNLELKSRRRSSLSAMMELWHLALVIRAELQVQSSNRRCRHRIGRFACGEYGLCVRGPREGRRHHSRTSDASCGEQPAATEIKVDCFSVVRGHRDEFLSAEKFIAT